MNFLFENPQFDMVDLSTYHTQLDKLELLEKQDQARTIQREQQAAKNLQKKRKAEDTALFRILHKDQYLQQKQQKEDQRLAKKQKRQLQAQEKLHKQQQRKQRAQDNEDKRKPKSQLLEEHKQFRQHVDHLNAEIDQLRQHVAQLERAQASLDPILPDPVVAPVLDIVVPEVVVEPIIVEEPVVEPVIEQPVVEQPLTVSDPVAFLKQALAKRTNSPLDPTFYYVLVRREGQGIRQFHVEWIVDSSRRGANLTSINHSTWLIYKTNPHGTIITHTWPFDDLSRRTLKREYKASLCKIKELNPDKFFPPDPKKTFDTTPISTKSFDNNYGQILALKAITNSHIPERKEFHKTPFTFCVSDQLRQLLDNDPLDFYAMLRLYSTL